jgi:DHA2 family lincomycin resistance protein-like MFS transporter
LTSAPVVAEPAASPKVDVVLGLLLAAAFVMILNETVMGVALPRMMEAFDVTASAAQWLTTAFLLTMAVVIPATGFILDRHPTRVVFTAAMSVFTAGTVLAAVAPVFGLLVAARVLQACGTAVMLPLLMTTIMTFVPRARRGRTMGLVSVVISVAPAVGPAFSGLILSFAPWRFVYVFVLPFAVSALVAGALMVRNLTEPRRRRFDLASVGLSIVAFGGLVYGLSSFGEAAQSEVTIPPALPVGVGLVGAALFVRRQLRLQRDDSAFLDLRPFKEKFFVLCLVLLLLAMAALFGVLILLPIYLQEVLRLSPLTTGLMLLPGGFVMGLAAPSVGRVYDRRGPRLLVLPASVLLLGSILMLSFVGEHTAPWFIVAAHVTLGLSLSMLFTPCITFAMGALPGDLYSHASAILSALQQLAGAAGTALFITVMAMSEHRSLKAGVATDVAVSDGIRHAFFCGVALTALMVVVAAFVKGRPTGSPDDRYVH